MSRKTENIQIHEKYTHDHHDSHHDSHHSGCPKCSCISRYDPCSYQQQYIVRCVVRSPHAPRHPTCPPMKTSKKMFIYKNHLLPLDYSCYIPPCCCI